MASCNTLTTVPYDMIIRIHRFSRQSVLLLYNVWRTRATSQPLFCVGTGEEVLRLRPPMGGR